ncbi:MULTISPECIES: TolC family protein [Sphingobacterium]|uniref:TolC family protein n=2 Tax=Sphingobacterium TaxID=28453 RepID=A0ABX7CYJ0_SPHMU|nr:MULTISPECIES: TolC family protein [Sphingobacterium]QQT32729.1 TolC family protein [Sphingobacterium multivorum]QQT56249.1 TolC family protein [Sphingobacterium multivorum]RKF34747.1 transporter [Sphingobacterium siyangense]
MKQNRTVPILGILLALFVQSLYAQHIENARVLSLEEIWKVAETNNRQLKLSDLHLQQSNLEILEAKDRLLPELSVGGDAKLNSKFLIYDNGLFSSPQDVPVKGYGYGVGYNLNVNLYNGGKDKRNIVIKKEQAVRIQYEVDLQKHSVKYNVAAAYFDLYKFLHFHDFLDAEIKAEKKQLALVESLHKNGTVLKSDVLRTSVKLAQLELSLSDVTKKIEIAKQRLNILMGRENDAELAIKYQDTIELSAITEGDYEDYVDIAFNKSPEYKIAYSAVKLSEMNIKQVKATLLPKVSLYSTYNYTYPQISFYPYSNDLWGFGQTGVKVQFSIDNLYKSKHSIAHAQVVSNEAREKANIKKDEIYLQVKDAYLQRQQALESMETAEQNIIKTAETVRVIRSSYINQESLLTDLLEAENALLEAKFNLTTAQTNVKLTHIRLLAIIGIL